jgi:hypothetical protein
VRVWAKELVRKRLLSMRVMGTKLLSVESLVMQLEKKMVVKMAGKTVRRSIADKP